MKLGKLKDMNERGSILLVFIITLPFLILLVIYYTSLSLTSYTVSRLDMLHTQAQLAADAGADYAVEQFNQDNTWTGTVGDVQLHSDSRLRTTYTASISGDSTSKTIAVTGKSYWPASATTPTRTVSIYVYLRPVTSGTFSVVSGEGGLTMSNSSKVVGGDVFVNGQVTMTNSAQIGLSTSPINLKVADQACPNPPDATYPRVCNSGEGNQPISIGNTAHVYGTVTANNQTDGSGMSSPGLVAGSVTPKTLPIYDRNAQKAAVATTITNNTASCDNNQTLTWAANTKITGDVTIKGKCKVTVAGNVWITGNLTMSNQAQLIVSNTLGSTMPVIMIDGAAGASFQNSSALASNSSNTGFEIITYYSKASCSPDCASVTGTDLASSRSVTTITLNNSGNEPNTLFYAYWSQVEVQQSGQIGALVGQTINLSNTGTITFGSSSGVSETTWVIKGYRKQ